MRRKTASSVSGHAIGPEGSEISQLLEGDLSEKPMSWLLKAAQHYEVTGRLQVGLAAINVVVQFGLGRAVHAQSPFCTGAEAVMDLFIWKDGRVRFESGRQPDTVSIQETIEDLVRRGENYAKSLAFLEHYGIGEMSFLVRPPQRLTEDDVKGRLAKGQPIDTNLQLEFYSNIYGTRNLKDTAEKMALPSSRWVSITANLLQLGILFTGDGKSVQVTDPAAMHSHTASAEYEALRLPDPGVSEPQSQPQLQPQSVLLHATSNDFSATTPSLWQTKVSASLQSSQILEAEVAAPANMIKLGVPDQIVALHPSDPEGVLVLLNEPESGIWRFEVLQYFLVREFARAYRFKTMLALVLFCVKLDGNENQFLPIEAAALLTGAVNGIKRDVDMFGHFGNRGFGLLLPNVDSDQACVLTDRINNDLVRLNPTLGQYRPCLHFGIASVPQDATELHGLVKAAQIAMFHAADNNLLKSQAHKIK